MTTLFGRESLTTPTKTPLPAFFDFATIDLLTASFGKIAAIEDGATGKYGKLLKAGYQVTEMPGRRPSSEAFHAEIRP